ncbi:MAG: hypothetical protein JWR10_1435 [Rubritepida sp.]|nr:hypothetical protein [Rubritepida sp.]
MMHALILIALLTLPGCSYFRSERQVVVAPNPVMYPAPAAEGRYIPWIGAAR